jgi:hypothetical protein
VRTLQLLPWVIMLHDRDGAFARAEVPIVEGPDITIDFSVIFTEKARQRATRFVIAKADGAKHIYPMRRGRPIVGLVAQMGLDE